MYRVDDMRDSSRHRILYYETLNEAENYAVLTMNSIRDKLPSGTWGRTEHGGDIMEYTERNAPGMARVYIRVFCNPSIPVTCQVCSERATFNTRAGYYCSQHEANP